MMGRRAASPTLLRIAIDVREWRRGTSTGIARFLTGFLEWAATGCDHRLMLIGNQHTEQRLGNGALGDPEDRIDLTREPESARWVWDHVILPRWLRSRRADVFLSPYYKTPLHRPCPAVATIHDLIPVLHPPSGEPSWRRHVVRRWMRLMLRRATSVVTDSQYSRLDLLQTLGLDETTTDVVPLRLDPLFSRPPPGPTIEATLSGHRLRPGYVLYVGRFEPHKNVSLLLDAWRALAPELRSAHDLVLVGAGGEDIGRDLPGVRPLGFVPDEDLPSIYAGAAVFGFPSLYEGFGLPPLEAMGCGTPVVCSNAASLPEVVGDAAMLVPPDRVGEWTEALERTLTDSGLRAELISAGGRRVERYRTECTAPRLMRVLEQAARRS